MLKPIYNVAHQRPEPRPLTGVPYSDHLAAASREFEQLCSTYSIDELRVFMPRNLPKPKKRKAK